MQRFSKVFHVDTIPSYSLRPWRALRFIYLTAECAGTAKISAKALTPVPPYPPRALRPLRFIYYATAKCAGHAKNSGKGFMPVPFALCSV